MTALNAICYYDFGSKNKSAIAPFTQCLKNFEIVFPLTQYLFLSLLCSPKAPSYRQ